MSRLYGERHRALQDQFETRKLADRVEEAVVKTAIGKGAQAFIESRDMFFLSSIDHQGRPTVSYKGGDPGFIKVIDEQTIVFPSYDGNGMFFSMGNIAGNAEVGLLFIDFETPNRVRLQGRATVSADDALVTEYREAEMIVRVQVSEIWTNCPRYVHRYQKVDPSRYVPRATGETPLAEWKRIDMLQDVLPPRDRGRAEKVGGIISMQEWAKNVRAGRG